MAVTTSLNSGSLTITGDAAADDIAIVGTSNPGELTITGRNGTLVNGVPNGSTTVSGITFSLNVDLSDGNDVVTLDDVFIAGWISIGTGNGNDTVTLGESGEVSSRMYLGINTGAGDDRVAELNYSVFVAREHWIVLGDGHDTATLVGVSAVGDRVRLRYDTGITVLGQDGNDSILGIGLTAVYRIELNGGSGVSSTALLFSAANSIDAWNEYDPDTTTNPGVNVLYLDTNYCQTNIGIETFHFLPASNARDSIINIFHSQTTSLSIYLAYGNNSLNLYGNAINGPSYNVFPGEASPYPVGPTLRVTRSSSGAALAPTADTLSLSYNIVGPSVVGAVSVALSHGDDSLFLTGNIFAPTATLNGGPGRNTIREWYNQWGSLTVQNFG